VTSQASHRKWAPQRIARHVVPVALGAAWATASCTFDWDRLDPRRVVENEAHAGSSGASVQAAGAPGVGGGAGRGGAGAAGGPSGVGGGAGGFAPSVGGTSGGGGVGPASGGGAGEGFGGTATGGAAGTAGSGPRPERVQRGLQVLYTFDEGTGETVHDRSGVGEPLDLTILDTTVTTWLSGALEFTGNAIVQSVAAATKIVSACKASNELAIEAWYAPVDLSQGGPAILVTVSGGVSERDFALAQNGSVWDVRVRMEDTDPNGSPSVTAWHSSTELTHLIYTLAADGEVTIYVDGVANNPVARSGGLQSWDESYRLTLANEVTRNRYWRGEQHLVAIYCVALTADEVATNFAAGP
jgi:hypothetical protein